MKKTSATHAIRTVNGEILYVAPLTRMDDEGRVQVQIVAVEAPTDEVIPVHNVGRIMSVPKQVLISL